MMDDAMDEPEDGTDSGTRSHESEYLNAVYYHGRTLLMAAQWH